MERKIRRSTSTSLLGPPDINLPSSPPRAIIAIPCCNQNGPPLPPLPVMPNCMPTAPLGNPNPHPHLNNPYTYPYPHPMIPLPEEPFIASPSSSSLSSSFLDSCFLCKRRLGQTRDIFIYRGDRAFCSVECRHHQILLDESKQKASGEKGNGHPKHHSGKVTMSTGTTAAA